MIEEDFESTGDVRKDYMAWSELLDRSPRQEIIYGIYLYIHRDPNEEDDKDLNGDFATNYSTDEEDEENKNEEATDTNDIPKEDELKPVKIEEFAELDDEEVAKLQSEFIIRQMRERLALIDVLAVSKAISTVQFNLKNIKLVSCGLSLRALRLLCTALGYRKTLRHLSIEMNPFKPEYEDIDRKALNRDELNNMINAIKPTNPWLQEKQPEPEQVEDKKGGKQAPKAPPKKTLKPQLETKNDFQEEMLNQLFIGAPLGPIFCTSAVHISLRGCDLNNEHAVQLATYLADNSTLISLNLFGNNISDDGAAALGKALLSNQKLKILSLAMNSISDNGVKELCKNLTPVELFTEQEFTKLRESVYKSHYGIFNLPKEQLAPTPSTPSHSKNPTPVQSEHPNFALPPLPQHLQPPPDSKKAATTKKPPAKTPVANQPSSTTNTTGVTLLEWESRCERFAPPEVIDPVLLNPKKDSRGSSRNPSPTPTKAPLKKGAKPEPPKIDVQPIEEEKPVVPAAPVPLFKVPGNSTLKSLNISMCRGVTDASGKYLIHMLSINKSIDRISFASTNISNKMIQEIANVLNERSK